MIRQHSRGGEIMFGYIPIEPMEDSLHKAKLVELPRDISQLSNSGLLELLPTEEASNTETVALAKRILSLINSYDRTSDTIALITGINPLVLNHPNKRQIMKKILTLLPDKGKLFYFTTLIMDIY